MPTAAPTAAGSDGAALEQRLVSVLGREHVHSTETDRRFFAADFVAEADVVPDLIVSPESTDEVAEVVRSAVAAGRRVVGRGGGMSYTRAHVPDRSDIVVVDLRRLDSVELHLDDRYAICGSGVTWAQLTEALAGTGLWAPHLGTLSGRYATVGGGLSQQVAGLTTTALTSLVLGLEVVLGDGRVLRTGAWAAQGTAPFIREFGPDLSGPFLCDSGAMGIKTRAVLRLDPVPASSYGCFAFEHHHDLVRTMTETARLGLATTCLGMDRTTIDGLASMPKPDRRAGIELARSVVRNARPRWRGVRTLARAGTPKMKHLDGVRYLLAVVCDAPDSAAADRLVKRVRSIAADAGGRALPIALPMGIRNAPFQEIHPLMFGASGESTIPTNMLVPLSAALPLVKAVDDYLLDQHAVMARHGISVSFNWVNVGHCFGIEPLLSFPGRPTPYRLHWASDEDRARYRNLPDLPEAAHAAVTIRAGMIEVARSMGSAHIQVGRSYPLAAALDGTTAWDVLTGFKSALDPGNAVNPGVLGLPS